MVTAMVGTNEMSTRQKIEEKGFNIFGLMAYSLQFTCFYFTMKLAGNRVYDYHTIWQFSYFW